MNLFDYCERYHISLSKARRQMKDGVLRLDETTSEEIMEIRHILSRGQPLTAAHLVELIENPGALLDLGRYAPRAEEQLREIGDAQKDAAPKMVAAYVTDAAKGDQEAVDALLVWLREAIPIKAVSHSFLAVRLLLGLAPNIRKFDIPRIPRALMECRKRPEFAEYWRVEKRPSRNVTIYQRPAKKNFDL